MFYSGQVSLSILSVCFSAHVCTDRLKLVMLVFSKAEPNVPPFVKGSDTFSRHVASFLFFFLCRVFLKDGNCSELSENGEKTLHHEIFHSFANKSHDIYFSVTLLNFTWHPFDGKINMCT